MSSKKENLSSTTQKDAEAAIQRWVCFTKNNSTKDILDLLYPIPEKVPDDFQKKFLKKITKDQAIAKDQVTEYLEQYSHCIQIKPNLFKSLARDNPKSKDNKTVKSKDNNTLFDRLKSTSPSIYVYIGLDIHYKTIEFYFIDSYTANLTKSDQNKKIYFKRSFSLIKNTKNKNQDSKKITEISYTKAQKRCNNWRNPISRREWGEAISEGKNMVRVFTIPTADFIKPINNNNLLYLYFGLTTDNRPNKHPNKIEFIVGQSSAPPKSGEATEAIGRYYNISIPSPPF